MMGEKRWGNGLRAEGSLCGNGVHAGSFRLFASQKIHLPNFLHAKTFSRWHNVRREANGRYAPAI